MGCIVGGGTEEQVAAAGQYGYYLGLAFQVIDDILDVTATVTQLGKPTGSDAENDKNTYVSLFGLEEAKRLAADYTEKAKAALAVLGNEGDDLRLLTEALLCRNM